jgi:FAD synthase
MPSNTHFLILTLNYLLIQHNVRSGYLIENHDIIKSTLYNVNNAFPNLYQRKTNYGIIVSKELLNNDYDNKNDTDHDYKLGKLLGYPTVDQYPISKKDITIGYYVYNVKVNLIKKTIITLFSFVAKNVLNESKIENLLNQIKVTLYNSEYSEYINDIYVERLKKRLTNNHSEKIIEQLFLY